MPERKVLVKRCPVCGKEFVDVSEKRLEYIVKLHMKLSHEKR